MAENLPNLVWVNGREVPGYFYLDGERRYIACTCGPDAPDEGCPYHGRSPYMVCETCNRGGHRCGGCGDDTTHEQPVCDGCLEDLRRAAGV